MPRRVHDGRDGRDGRDGIDGKNGKDGVNGRDGRDGSNGRDAVLVHAFAHFDRDADTGFTWRLRVVDESGASIMRVANFERDENGLLISAEIIPA